MEISKTLFKEYSKCNNYFYLDDIYYSKHQRRDDKSIDINNILNKMFNEDGEDLINVLDEQLEVMLPYYQDTERLALQEATKIFGVEFTYHKETKDQKSFRFIDNNNNQIYTYVDGYNEIKDEIIIIEVKSTSNRRLLNLGPKIKGKCDSVFDNIQGIYQLKKTLSDKQLEHLKYLYCKDDDIGKYFYDFAITRYIINEQQKTDILLKNKKIKYYLAVFNYNYVYDGKINQITKENDYFNTSEHLFSFYECNDILKEYAPIIKNDYEQVLVSINNKCLSNVYQKVCQECIYKNICFERIKKEYSITTLLNPKKIKEESVISLINKGYSLVTDIPKYMLDKPNHIIQREAIDTQNPIIQINQIKEKISEIAYPIYHLDFESFNCPLPRFYGEKPYTQSVFQFSIHIQQEPMKCDRYKDNYYFVPTDFGDHREELVKEMIRIIDLSKGGTVLTYNKTFESSRIKELMTIFPLYQNQLQMILDHIYDLKDVIKGVGNEKVNYYHHLLNGSYSIKKVLPLFSPLTYKELDVQNGIEAIVAYSKFKYLPKEDIIDLRDKLVKYCGLDTYSMVVILDSLRKEVGYE